MLHETAVARVSVMAPVGVPGELRNDRPPLLVVAVHGAGDVGVRPCCSSAVAVTTLNSDPGAYSVKAVVAPSVRRVGHRPHLAGAGVDGDDRGP